MEKHKWFHVNFCWSWFFKIYFHFKHILDIKMGQILLDLFFFRYLLFIFDCVFFLCCVNTFQTKWIIFQINKYRNTIKIKSFTYCWVLVRSCCLDYIPTGNSHQRDVPVWIYYLGNSHLCVTGQQWKYPVKMQRNEDFTQQISQATLELHALPPSGWMLSFCW